MFSGAQSVAVEPHGTCFYRGRSISHLRLIEIAWALWMARCNDVSNNERQSPSVLIIIVAQFAQLSRNLIPTWRCVCVLASLITGTWSGSGTNDVPDRFPTSGLFLVKEWQGYLPYLSTRFPAFRRELHRSALQRGGCQHVIITKSFPPQLPTKKEVEYETGREGERERDRWHNCGKNVRGQHTNKDQIYRHTFEERTHSMSATKRKQPLEKKRMVSSISKR